MGFYLGACIPLLPPANTLPLNPSFAGEQVGGYVTSYGVSNKGATVAAAIGRRLGGNAIVEGGGSSGTLELAIVLTAGHAVPAFQPAGVFQLVQAWTSKGV